LSSSSAWFFASRIALVATGMTSSIPAWRQNDPKTIAVCTARLTREPLIVPESAMPADTRTASRISSTCCQWRPGSHP
jgi:hypothetical protein